MPFQAQTHSRERPESIPPQAIPDDLLWGIILGVFEFIECKGDVHFGGVEEYTCVNL